MATWNKVFSNRSLTWAFILVTLLYLTLVGQQYISLYLSYNQVLRLTIVIGECGYIAFAHLGLFITIMALLTNLSVSYNISKRVYWCYWLASLILFFSWSGHGAQVIKLIAGMSWFFLSSLLLHRLLRKILSWHVEWFICGTIIFVAGEMVLLLLGCLGLATNTAHWALALTPGAVAIANIITLKRTGTASAIPQAEPLKPAGWFWLEVIFVIFCLYVLQAFTPSSLTDASQLHDAKTQLIAAGGGIRAILDWPYQPFYFFPSFLHILHSFGYSLLGEIGIAVVSLCMFWALAAALVNMGCALGLSSSFAMGATALFLAVPAYGWMIGTGYLDFSTSALGIIALQPLLRHLAAEKPAAALRPGPKVLLFMTGMLLAAAANSKLNQLFFLVSCLVAAMAWHGWRRSPSGLNLRLLGWLVSGSLVVYLPHLLASFIISDNPLYPALNTWFKSPYFNSAIPVSQHQFHKLNWYDLLLLPFTATVHTSWFGETSDGGLGPWFLLFFPCLFFLGKRQKDRLALFLATTAVIYVCLLHLNNSYYYRYYLPGLGLLALALARGCQNYVVWGREIVPTWLRTRLSWIALIMIALLSAPPFFLTEVHAPSLDHWKYYRRGNPWQWLQRYYPANVPSFMEFATRLPPQATVLFDGYEMVSSLGRVSFETDNSTQNWSGMNDIHPARIAEHRNRIALWLQENILGYKYHLNKHGSSELLDEGALPLAAAIQWRADVLVVANIWSYHNDSFKKDFMTADRLLYTSSDNPHHTPRFLAAFAVNDRLFPRPPGVGFTHRPGHPPLAQRLTPQLGNLTTGGGFQPQENWEEARATRESPLAWRVRLAGPTRWLNLKMDLAYQQQPDPAATLTVKFIDAQGAILKTVTPGAFSESFAAAFIVRQAVPPQTQALEMVLTPQAGGVLGLKSFELFLAER